MKRRIFILICLLFVYSFSGCYSGKSVKQDLVEEIRKPETAQKVRKFLDKYGATYSNLERDLEKLEKDLSD